jgi:hypothetical protein
MTRDKWVVEAKKRIGSDFEAVGACFLSQRAVASDKLRKQIRMSKTQLEHTVDAQDRWIRHKITRLAAVEVVLERHKLLGKLVWRIYDRFLKAMKKDAEIIVPGQKKPPVEKPAPELGNMKAAKE